MPINLRSIILHLLLTFSLSLFHQAWGKSILNIQSWTTPNGTRVLFTEAHEIPMVDLKVIFYAGAARDGQKFGLASLVNTMLKEGTKTLTADHIADNFDQIGAHFTTSTRMDTATVALRCLTDTNLLNRALPTFISVLTEPTFPRREFKRVQQQILTEIKQQQQNPASVALEAFFNKLYGDFPYGHTILGTRETVGAITPSDLLKFYQTYYTASNAVIVIVGAVTRDQAKIIANSITSKLAPGVNIPPLPELTTKPQTITHHINFPTLQTNVIIGQIGIKHDSADYFPLYLGNYILGKAAFISELNQEIREKRGLVYSIASYFVPLQQPGPFIINFSSSNETVKEAIHITMKLFKRFLQVGPTEAQLVAAKTSLIAKLPLEFASNKAISNNLTLIGTHNLPLNYFDTYIDKIKAVTVEQVRNAFKRHIDPERMITITVGKA